MPFANVQLDDELLTDASVPIAGVNNSLPPSAIGKSEAEDAENRLAQMDGLNRPRPGIIRLAVTGSGLNSIHHLGNGVFLTNNGASWYKYNNRTNVLTPLTGGPAYSVDDSVYSTLADSVLYFSKGGSMSKYDPATGFGTVTLPTAYPTALYPVWALQRLIYVYQNTLVVSDILDPEHVDVITGSVTLDPIVSDEITGQALWKNQQIVVWRNGSTWLIQAGPDLDVPDWSVQRVSSVIGCRVHGSIMQCGNDIYFLSETGRGVYALGQAPTSDEEGLWVPISKDVQDYIDRINWAAADCVRAAYWNGLYMLSVPLDGVTYNNFILIYSVTLKLWQGLWCFEVSGADAGACGFARDQSDPDATALMVATRDGMISRFSYPTSRRYYDQNIDMTKQYYESWIKTRSFTFGEDVNLIQPQMVKLQFLESDDPVTVAVFVDRSVEVQKREVDTTSYFLQLTIPGFPFDLDRDGYRNQTLGLMKCGICNEVQFVLKGTGNWSLFQIKATAFETMIDVAR